MKKKERTGMEGRLSWATKLRLVKGGGEKGGFGERPYWKMCTLWTCDLQQYVCGRNLGGGGEGGEQHVWS